MTKRRTKAKKLKTKQKRTEGKLPGVVYKLDKKMLVEAGGGGVEETGEKKVDDSPVELLEFDSKLLKKDLVKTIFLSGVMFASVILVYAYLTVR